MYEIKRASFVTSLTKAGPFEGRGLREVVIAGRSNVGKSSLINCLCNRKSLARTSSEPGKTRLINIYLINDAFILTDLPGYGYAKVSRREQATWGPMIEGYLKTSGYIAHALLIVDMRHEPTADDRAMAGFLRHYGIPFTTVMNKADKLSRSKRPAATFTVCRALGVQPWEVIAFSAVDRTGKDDVLALLERVSGAASADVNTSEGNGGQQDADGVTLEP